MVSGAAAWVLTHSPGNVSNPNVAFDSPPSKDPSTTVAKAPPRKAAPPFAWPRYGYSLGRTRVAPAVSKLEPPFRTAWTYQSNAYLEFPPVIYGKRLFLCGDDGVVKAVNLVKGHQIWQKKVGTLAAASPAIGAPQGLVFLPSLSTHGTTPGNGRFVALSMKTGKIAWSIPLPHGSESSPLAYKNTVYFGDQGGDVYSVRAGDGHVNWVYHASAAVKGGPALVNGVLYFGDYAGRAYAIHASNGKQVWAVSTNGAHFGLGSGTFYSGPSVAFGRVYMGNTDGRVYSFATSNGALGWATETGGYVYASPAVSDIPGLGPTVFVGSYSGRFYALNARTGAIRWVHEAGGRISGSATIVGNVVYYSDLGSKTSAGLNVRTGQQVFSFPDGTYNAAIADRDALFMTGMSKVYELLPRTGRSPSARAKKHRPARAKKSHAAKARTRAAKARHHVVKAKAHAGKRTHRKSRQR